MPFRDGGEKSPVSSLLRKNSWELENCIMYKIYKKKCILKQTMNKYVNLYANYIQMSSCLFFLLFLNANRDFNGFLILKI